MKTPAERRRDWIITGLGIAALAAALFFGLTACAVSDEWKPQPGDPYKVVLKKIGGDCGMMSIDGDEVRWYLSADAAGWIYYTRFDKPVLNFRILRAGQHVEDVLSDAVLVEMTYRPQAYDEFLPRPP